MFLFARNKKEFETQTKTIRIYGQEIGMEFGIVKCVVMKLKKRRNSGKKNTTKSRKHQIGVDDVREKERKSRGSVLSAPLNDDDDGYFSQQPKKIAHTMNFSWLRRGNLKRENESILIATLDNIIRINYIKVKLDNSQKSRKCRLCGDRNKHRMQIGTK